MRELSATVLGHCEFLMKSGAGRATLADYLGCDTLAELDAAIEANEALSEAIRRGDAAIEERCLRALLDDLPTKGRFRAATWLLEHRFGYATKEAADHRVKIEIALPAALTERQFLEAGAVEPTDADALPANSRLIEEDSGE